MALFNWLPARTNHATGVPRVFRNAALPAGLLVAGWSLSGWLYAWMSQDRVRYNESRYESIITGVESDLRIRLAAYENALRFAAGDLAASNHLADPEDWHTFVQRLELFSRYPGTEVISLIRPVTDAQVGEVVAAERARGNGAPPKERFVITAAEPPNVAARAIGADLAADPVRKAAAERARDTGTAALTRNLPLSNKAGNGLQLLFPIYRKGAPVASVEDRRAALTGWVTVVLSSDAFFRSALRTRASAVDLTVFDGAVAPQNLMFSTLGPAVKRPFERTSTLTLDGTTWMLAWNQAGQFPLVSKAPSVLAGACCAFATLLLAALVRRLQSTAQRAQTRLEREERAVEETKAFLAALVQSSDDSIVGTTLDGTILSWNRGSELLWGYTAQEAIGKPITMLFLPERLADFRPSIERVIRNDHNERFETVRVRKDGAVIDISVILSPVKDARGRLLGISAIYSDISERKQAERELRKAKEAAEAANQAKSQFLANMSHEIRTPMNGVLGMNEVLLDTELTEEQREYVNIAKISAEALLAVINDILDLSKIEAGMLLLDPREFRVRDTISAVVKPLAVSAGKKGLKVACRIGESVPDAVWGDPLRIRQVLMNLVGNAIKFTERGEVRISVEAAPADMATFSCELRFAVSDTGIGISREQQSVIFDAFTQADGSITRRYGGTGLGLTISRRLVEMMGGRIAVKSEPQQGSTFWFTVPITVVEHTVPSRSLAEMPALASSDPGSAEDYARRLSQNSNSGSVFH